MSGLKKSVFDKLVLSMVTLKKETPEDVPKVNKPIKRTRTFLEAVEEKAKGMMNKIRLVKINILNWIDTPFYIAMDEENACRDAEEEVPQVDFAAWKRRMLEEAKRQ